MARRLGLALLVLGLTLTLTPRRPAQACQCSLKPRRQIWLAHGDGVKLPTNGRVRLLLEPDAVLESASLRRVAHGDGPAVVVATTQRWAGAGAGAGADRVLELVPLEPLPPRTRHQVAIMRPGGALEVLGSFETAAGPDRVAPRGGMLSAGRFVKKVGCNGCCSQRAFGEVRLAAASDADGRAADLLVAVWIASEGAALDLRRPPHSLLDVGLRSPGRVVLGPDPWSCLQPSLGFPDGVRRLEVALRVVDLAGHYGPVSTVSFDLEQPEADERPWP